jgi:hypothetical protein
VCARLRADTALSEAEKRRRIREFYLRAAAAGSARSAPAPLAPIRELVVWLRSVEDHPADLRLGADLLIEGERVAGASARGIPAAIGELHSLSMRTPAPIPSRACRDLELDLQLAAGERASFAIEAVELRSAGGASSITLFAQPGVVVLDAARRGIALAVRGDACAE